MTPDQLTIDAIRVLSAEAIEKAKSGHPGLPLGAADAAYALWFTCMRHNPENPGWLNRDRFVLSCGHGSMLIYYSLLHLFGYGLTMEDLKSVPPAAAPRPPAIRSISTPSAWKPPPARWARALANAVGMAMAEKHLAAKFNREGFPVVDHYTYAILGDGCMMEGISHEACSLAGTLGLNKLIVLYDDNEISIEGEHGHRLPRGRARPLPRLWLERDRREGGQLTGVRSPRRSRPRSAATRPTLIVCHTTIGFGSPKAGKAVRPRRAPGRRRTCRRCARRPGLGLRSALHRARGRSTTAAAR